MTSAPALLARLQFLDRVVARECRHLKTTDRRLFAEPFSEQRAAALEDDPEAGHDFVSTLIGAAEAMAAEIKKRGWGIAR